MVSNSIENHKELNMKDSQPGQQRTRSTMHDKDMRQMQSSCLLIPSPPPTSSNTYTQANSPRTHTFLRASSLLGWCWCCARIKYNCKVLAASMNSPACLSTSTEQKVPLALITQWSQKPIPYPSKIFNQHWHNNSYSHLRKLHSLVFWTSWECHRVS